MSTSRLACTVEWQAHTEGWLLSLFLHGLAAGVAFWLVTDLHLAPQPEPFRWDVSVLAAPSSPGEYSVPPTPADPVRPSKLSPAAKAVQRAESGPDVILHHVQDAASLLQTETQAPQIPDRASQPVDVPKDSVPVTSTPTPQTKTVEASTKQEPVAQDATNSMVASAPKSDGMPAAASSKGDYGWLAQTLWSRVEKLKRYPHIARANRWEGRVLLRAVIAEDGRLKDLAIIRSSGYAELDRDALETLKEASPVPLSQPLGRHSVVIQIPISYTLH